MRHVITFALVATILLVSVAVAHPGMMNKECWENRPTVKPTDCCKGLTMLPEAALEECNKLYPEEDDNVEEAQDNNDNDNDDDEDDSENKKKPHHHHHHRHHHGKHPCIVECYFNKTGVFKDLQVVKATALKLFSDNTDSSGTFQATLSASIDTCIVEQELMEKRFKEMLANGDHPHHGPPHGHHGGKDGKHCPPKAMHFTKCVEINAFKSCPADRKVSSAECTKLTEFVEKCGPKKME